VPSALHALPVRRLAAFVAIAAVAVAACATGGSATAPSPTPTLAPTTPPSANPYTGATAGSAPGSSSVTCRTGPGALREADQRRHPRPATTAGVDLVTCDVNVDPTKVDGCMKQLTGAGSRA